MKQAPYGTPGGEPKVRSPLTWIRSTLTRLSKSFSTALGNNRVTVRRTLVYSDTVVKTRLAVMALPSSTYTVKVMKTMTLPAEKKEAVLAARR